MNTFEIYGTEIEVPDEFTVFEYDYGVWISYFPASDYGVKIMDGFSDPLIVLPVEKMEGNEVDRLLELPYRPLDKEKIQSEVDSALRTAKSRARKENPERFEPDVEVV